MTTSRLGPFALEGPLGSNDTSSVYRAVQIQQRRTVAVKVFSAPLVASSAKAKAEFTRESKLLRKLKHPHIVRCHGAGLVGMQGYLALELVEGESLKDVLRRRGKLGWDSVLDYALQMCSALEFAHEVGINHLDLSPEKVLIGESDQVKIVDFRLDRLTNTLCASSQERTLERIAYMAPEVIRREQDACQKADLYSLGCILFETLTGQTPFQADSAEAMAEQHLHESPPRVSSIGLDCPVWFDGLVDQLLQKDIHKRPFSASAVLLALNEAQKKIAVGMGVAEHATRGFSPLSLELDKEEAHRLLRPRQAPLRQRIADWLQASDAPPIYQQTWFLLLCLSLIAGFFGWAMWPASPEQLLEKADVLMATEERSQWLKAKRDYLEPLISRFPDHPATGRAQRHMDRIEMQSALRRMKFNQRIDRVPTTEGESLYAEAWGVEQDGDLPTALLKYRQMVELLSSKGKDRPFVLLAKQQIDRLTKELENSENENNDQYVSRRLEDADRLAASGQRVAAELIWQSIVTLYGDDPNLESLVQRARTQLRDQPIPQNNECGGSID